MLVQLAHFLIHSELDFLKRQLRNQLNQKMFVFYRKSRCGHVKTDVRSTPASKRVRFGLKIGSFVVFGIEVVVVVVLQMRCLIKP